MWNNPVKTRSMSYFPSFCSCLPELYPSTESSIWWAFLKRRSIHLALPVRIKVPQLYTGISLIPYFRGSKDWFWSSGSNPELQTPPTRTDRTGCVRERLLTFYALTIIYGTVLNAFCHAKPYSIPVQPVSVFTDGVNKKHRETKSYFSFLKKGT